MVLVLIVVAIFSLINSIQCNTIQTVIDELGIIEGLVNGLGCDSTGILHTVYTSIFSLG